MRHFALVETGPANQGSLLIVKVRNSVRPSHLFDRTSIMITCSNSPREGSGMPNQ
jgi:hypothetical protein